MNLFKKLLVATLTISSFFITSLPVVADDVSEAVIAALKNKNRPENDTYRDAQRKPDQVLSFYGIKAGMTVLDLYSSTGYYSVILSNLVGANGTVIAHNTDRGKERFGDILLERYKAFPNINLRFSDPTDQGVEDASVDAIMLVLLYHHLHYNKDEGEVTPKRTKAILAEAYRVLKPGGIIGIIEHEAAEGINREDSAKWHRTPAAAAIADFGDAGFTYVGSAPIHVNPDDDMKNNWNTAGLRGKTTRFVQKFTKK
jgi:predicted methyltransferase